MIRMNRHADHNVIQNCNGCICANGFSEVNCQKLPVVVTSVTTLWQLLQITSDSLVDSHW